MADSSFRRELVAAALPAAIEAASRNQLSFEIGSIDPQQLAQMAADFAILVAKATDESYDKLVAAERAIDQLVSARSPLPPPSAGSTHYICDICKHSFAIVGDFPTDKFCPRCGMSTVFQKR